MIEVRRPQPLDPLRHDRSGFDCGVASLDTWVRAYAGQNRRRDSAATWVIAGADDRVLAYVSLAMSSVDSGSVPARLRRGAPAQVPVLLLGRLAVDREVRGAGLGTALVEYALATAVELNARAACRAVVVNALDSPARAWWQRLGFEPFGDDPGDPGFRDLFLLTADVLRLADEDSG